jgi:hypothetical protein
MPPLMPQAVAPKVVSGSKGAKVVVPTISSEAQHVIDSLEAHYVALTKFAAASSGPVLAQLESLSNAILAKLEAWGVGFRAELEQIKSVADSGATGAGSLAASTSPASGSAASAEAA